MFPGREKPRETRIDDSPRCILHTPQMFNKFDVTGFNDQTHSRRIRADWIEIILFFKLISPLRHLLLRENWMWIAKKHLEQDYSQDRGFLLESQQQIWVARVSNRMKNWTRLTCPKPSQTITPFMTMKCWRTIRSNIEPCLTWLVSWSENGNPNDGRGAAFKR